ncbi:hypothetical protein FB107DRAFT_250542 [Schizophyllum commune]
MARGRGRENQADTGLRSAGGGRGGSNAPFALIPAIRRRKRSKFWQLSAGGRARMDTGSSLGAWGRTGGSKEEQKEGDQIFDRPRVLTRRASSHVAGATIAVEGAIERCAERSGSGGGRRGAAMIGAVDGGRRWRRQNRRASCARTVWGMFPSSASRADRRGERDLPDAGGACGTPWPARCGGKGSHQSGYSIFPDNAGWNIRMDRPPSIIDSSPHPASKWRSSSPPSGPSPSSPSLVPGASPILPFKPSLVTGRSLFESAVRGTVSADVVAQRQADGKGQKEHLGMLKKELKRQWENLATDEREKYEAMAQSQPMDGHVYANQSAFIEQLPRMLRGWLGNGPSQLGHGVLLTLYAFRARDGLLRRGIVQADDGDDCPGDGPETFIEEFEGRQALMDAWKGYTSRAVPVNDHASSQLSNEFAMDVDGCPAWPEEWTELSTSLLKSTIHDFVLAQWRFAFAPLPAPAVPWGELELAEKRQVYLDPRLPTDVLLRDTTHAKPSECVKLAELFETLREIAPHFRLFSRQMITPPSSTLPDTTLTSARSSTLEHFATTQSQNVDSSPVTPPRASPCAIMQEDRTPQPPPLTPSSAATGPTGRRDYSRRRKPNAHPGECNGDTVSDEKIGRVEKRAAGQDKEICQPSVKRQRLAKRAVARPVQPPVDTASNITPHSPPARLTRSRSRKDAGSSSAREATRSGETIITARGKTVPKKTKFWAYEPIID